MSGKQHTDVEKSIQEDIERLHNRLRFSVSGSSSHEFRRKVFLSDLVGEGWRREKSEVLNWVQGNYYEEQSVQNPRSSRVRISEFGSYESTRSRRRSIDMYDKSPRSRRKSIAIHDKISELESSEFAKRNSDYISCEQGRAETVSEMDTSNFPTRDCSTVYSVNDERLMSRR